MKEFVIGRKRYNPVAFKGYTLAKFLKEKRGSEEDYKKLEPFIIEVKEEIKKTKKGGK